MEAKGKRDCGVVTTGAYRLMSRYASQLLERACFGRPWKAELGVSPSHRADVYLWYKVVLGARIRQPSNLNSSGLP